MTTQHPLGGVLLFVCGLFLFACMDTTVKYLTAFYPVPVIAALRYIVHALLMLALLAPTQGRQLLQTTRTGWVLVRSACLAGATICMGMALTTMPLAETTAIVFISPLVVVLLAGPLLGEKVALSDWAGAVVGFMGILLIARPGGVADLAGMLFALGAICVMAAYQILSRVLAATERTISMLFYSALFGSVVFGLTLPWYWDGPVPPPEHLLLFLVVGASGGLGHFLFTAAYRQAPASALAPLMYVQLVWAGLLGWLVFGHIPDGLAILGMSIVAACGIAVSVKSHHARRKAAAAVDMEP